jgi:outer membrane receptor protein involved in Fe transport
MRKSAWLLSAGLFALAAPAFAQDAPPAGGQAGPEQQAAAAQTKAKSLPTKSSSPRTDGARRFPTCRSPSPPLPAETLQNTGANDIRQLNQVAPSLLVSSTGSEANGSARIRGIGTVGDNPGLESSVAVFIDGVYRSRSGIGLNELGEIERVEVLRGPQGTLFGRNASAGLIHIISKQPSLSATQGNAELTYGNYDFLRASGSMTGPIMETLAARLDGVYVQRDGFYRDINNNTDVNDRDRYFVRGQLLFEPSSELSIRLIGDYTKRDEKCCGAVYVNGELNPFIGNLNTPATPILVGGAVNPNGNNIINVIRDLGQTLAAFSNPFSRNIYVTPGRSYAGETEDKGISGEVNWEFGGTTLTSITGYREYDSDQGSDTDYSTVDILYRAPDGGASRRFRTFSQELRLQGTIFGDRLDWLVGGYYADEDLTVTDNLRFGNQYGRFATCRIVSGGGLAALYSPASPGCLAARPALFGPASPLIFAGFDRLDSINNRGSTRDRYFQNSRNYAFFTHNILHITDQLDLTLGLRYTNERKRFNATFGNDNTACVRAAGRRSGRCSPTPLGAACGRSDRAHLPRQFDLGAERRHHQRSPQRERVHRHRRPVLQAERRCAPLCQLLARLQGGRVPTSTARPSSRRSCRSAARRAPKRWSATCSSIRRSRRLRARPEFSSRPINVNVAIFRQDFSNFQLNTFNGTVFLVQTINGCGTDLGGGDRDQNIAPSAPNFNANAPTTGRCDAGDVTYGVRSQGVEVEVRFARFATWPSISVSPTPRRNIATIWWAARAAFRSIRRSASFRATICPTHRKSSSPARSLGLPTSAIRACRACSTSIRG